MESTNFKFAMEDGNILLYMRTNLTRLKLVEKIGTNLEHFEAEKFENKKIEITMICIFLKKFTYK